MLGCAPKDCVKRLRSPDKQRVRVAPLVPGLIDELQQATVPKRQQVETFWKKGKTRNRGHRRGAPAGQGRAAAN